MFDGQINNEEPLLEVSDLAMEYNVQGKSFFAISDINLSIKRGEALGLVGESCGYAYSGRRGRIQDHTQAPHHRPKGVPLL